MFAQVKYKYVNSLKCYKMSKFYCVDPGKFLKFNMRAKPSYGQAH